ncbi:hypothetical protein [Clostridium sp. CTA-6]
MGLITWDINKKYGDVNFTNQNLTTRLISSRSKVCSTSSKKGGKFYIELTTNKYQLGVYLGIFNIDNYNIINSDYPPSSNNVNSIITTNYPHTDNLIFNTGDITGMAIDGDKGVVKFYCNGQLMLEKEFNFQNFNIILGCASMDWNEHTANFGATQFDITTSNPEEWEKLEREGYAPYDNKNANWFKTDKYLINQNKNYYLINSNFLNLGQPTDNTQLQNWYNKYGADDVNIITENLNNKEFPMSKSENGIWKTDFQLDMNDVTDNIDLVDTDENNKSIKYDCNDYRILDLCDDEFDIRMFKEK